MKTNVYEMVTNRILEELKKGIIPWHRPWSGTIDGAVNYVSRKPYSLLNQLLLGEDGEFLTFNQAKELGGNVKKGAKSKFVVFYTNVNYKKINEDGKEVIESYPCLKYYHVFHLRDCEGIASKIDVAPAEKKHPIEDAENVIGGYLSREEKLAFENENPSNRAYYSPVQDTVVVPMIEQFEKEQEYYSTCFHELVHSTMKAYRCDREADNKDAAFGNEVYSREELVAEIGAAMLCSNVGIDKPFKNSVAYIQSWMKALQNDERMIVWAASRAEKAAKYILGINDTKKEEE